MKPFCFAISACALLSACGTERQLLVNSSPQGAIMYEPSTGHSGRTPTTATYTLPESMRQTDGCFHVSPFQIVWDSGARVQGDPRFCGAGFQFQQTYQRPEGVFGLETDLRVAADVQAQAEAIRQQQQQAAAQALGAMAYGIGQAAGYAAAAPAYRPVQQQSVNCTSSVIGNQIYTNC